MTRAQLAPWAIQAAVGFIAAAIGTYVAVQVQANSIAWIAQIQRNHETRIEALESRVFLDRNGKTASGPHKSELHRSVALAPELRELLPLKLPGVELATGPGDALRAIQHALVDFPALPGFADCAQVAFEACPERKRRDGWHAPPTPPAARGFAVDGQTAGDFLH